jgi:hypothetical protein
MRTHRSRSNGPLAAGKVGGRRATNTRLRWAGKALTWLIVLAVLAVPIGVVLIGLDLLVNRKVQHLPWLHVIARPFEAVVFAAIVLAVATLWIRIIVGGAHALFGILLIVLWGRSVPGTVVKHLRTEHTTDADGDPMTREYWQVQFDDGSGKPRLVEYWGTTVQPGTTLRVRHQLDRPENFWVRKPGLSTLTGSTVGYVLVLGIWIFLASPILAFAIWLSGRV